MEALCFAVIVIFGVVGIFGLVDRVCKCIETCAMAKGAAEFEKNKK
jgi:hypothetical protein